MAFAALVSLFKPAEQAIRTSSLPLIFPADPMQLAARPRRVKRQSLRLNQDALLTIFALVTADTPVWQRPRQRGALRLTCRLFRQVIDAVDAVSIIADGDRALQSLARRIEGERGRATKLRQLVVRIKGGQEERGYEALERVLVRTTKLENLVVCVPFAHQRRQTENAAVRMARQLHRLRSFALIVDASLPVARDAMQPNIVALDDVLALVADSTTLQRLDIDAGVRLRHDEASLDLALARCYRQGGVRRSLRQLHIGAPLPSAARDLLFGRGRYDALTAVHSPLSFQPTGEGVAGYRLPASVRIVPVLDDVYPLCHPALLYAHPKAFSKVRHLDIAAHPAQLAALTEILPHLELDLLELRHECVARLDDDSTRETARFARARGKRTTRRGDVVDIVLEWHDLLEGRRPFEALVLRCGSQRCGLTGAEVEGMERRCAAFDVAFERRRGRDLGWITL